MITEKDAIDLINLAESLGITVFLDGGWGVDALLGRQTREHQDIDLFVEETQAARFIRALHQQGFKERTEAYSTPQHIVFADADGRTVDLHLFTYTSDGEIVFEGETYPADTFSGEGCIGEKKVSCIPPQAQVAFHTGYVFDENDVKDVLAPFPHPRSKRISALYKLIIQSPGPPAHVKISAIRPDNRLPQRGQHKS